MQNYLPLIKTMLSEWYLFTLNNPLYAAALAITVWLLTAMLYSIRIAAIKRGGIAEQKAAAKNLNDMQQQLQQSQEALAETVEQTEKAQHAAQNETQRALTLEQLIYQRNRQIAGTIQTLASSFDLGERPLPATEDVKADALWQQHDKVITQLTERLRTELQAKIALQQTCQAEAAKLAEKEALLKDLQTTLNDHTNQLSKLELALEQQTAILQHQDSAQQLICDTLKKYQPGAMSSAEPEPEPLTIPSQPVQLEESPDSEEILIVQPTQDDQAEPAHDEAAVSRQVEPSPIEPVELIAPVEDVAPVSIEITPQSVNEETQPVLVAIEQEPAAPAKGSFGKIKNLFGKKQQPVKTEPQWTVAEPESQALPLTEEPQPVSADDEAAENAKSKPGKLKGFYSKFTSKAK